MKKIMIAILHCLCLFPLMSAMEPYPEFEQLERAESGRRNQKEGFQGCVNKKQCGEYGFYLAKYSQEGLCKTCEFKQFPQRFVDCLFCRKPALKPTDEMRSFSCLMCKNKIENMLVQKLALNDDQKYALARGAYRYFSKINQLEGKKYIKDFSDYKNCTNGFRYCDLYEHPHVYIGAKRLENGHLLHVWVNEIAIDPSDKRMVSDRDEAETYIKFICEKYNIFGPETGEHIVQNLPEDAITYQEVMR